MLLGGEGYDISRSVRLRSSASAYFNRTPASAGNRKTWTWSGWVKRGALGSTQQLFQSGYSTNPWFLFEFEADNTIQVSFSAGTSGGSYTSAVFRDSSAWYHIVLKVDTTQATAANRVMLYVNGVLQTFGTTNYPSQNFDTQVNNTLLHTIGGYASLGGYYLDGYLTEVNFIDGQALTPSSFGETDSITGVWKPKKYAGTYGTNGFFLNFSDNSSNTATTIGKDYSGNGNNWTPNNISVTSGVSYDSMLDVPTMWADGGNGRGNYCVLNPLAGGLTPINGNLTSNQGSAAWVSTASTFTLNSGKWYFEIGQTALSGTNYSALGLRPIGQVGSGEYAGSISGSYGAAAGPTALAAYSGGTSGSSISGSYSSASVFQCAVDFDAGKVWFGDGSSWIGGGSPASGTSPTYTFTAGTSLVPYVSAYANQTNPNFGQRPFAYTPPTGFKALNTQNLPDATIKKGNAYFDATLYTGNGTAITVTNSGGFAPDLVWTKARGTTTGNHSIGDTVRGTGKVLCSDLTNAEISDAQTYTAFNSNGFSYGNEVSGNRSGNTMVSWQWKESASAGFDIVTYNGSASAQTLNHSLGVAPSMMIIKSRGGTVNWGIYHKSLGSGSPQSYVLQFDTSAQFGPSSTYWNSTAPTSTQFTVGTLGNVNASGAGFVAYLFAEVAGYSKFGSYTGNGSTDGTFVYLGFRPRFIMIKRTDTTSNWIIKDTARSAYNAGLESLYPNLSNAEGAGETYDVLSNGFKPRSTSTEFNASGGTYIYAAFAENPFKNSLAR
jgi:hypothetical protein